MINNLTLILHFFRDIAFDGSKIAIFGYPLVFNSDDNKILPGRQEMANVPKGVETMPKISIARVGCTNVTDERQTDRRQTDGRRHITNVNWNVLWVYFRVYYTYYIFSALHGMQTRSRDEKAVCPSVRPSVCLWNARIVTKQKKDLCRFLYRTKEHLA